MQKRTIQPKRPVPVRAAGSEPSSSLQWDDIRHFLALAREALCAGSADTWMDTPLEAIARIVVL
ncbi:hypothetical protein ACQCRM_17125, partial [Ralstonia pseudosolanacearum]